MFKTSVSSGTFHKCKFRRQWNGIGTLRTSLVHTPDNQATTCAGSYSCNKNTSCHISSDTNLQGPKDSDSITIRESFTCSSSGLIYYIYCRRCPSIHIGESRRTLGEWFGEHIRSITKCATGLPVAEHFSSNGHSAADAQVHGDKLYGGNKPRKRKEMRLIFQLGTFQPCGFNSDFHFYRGYRGRAC